MCLFELVGVYEALVLFELAAELSSVDVVAGLEAEELEVVDLSELRDVLQVLARVAC